MYKKIIIALLFSTGLSINAHEYYNPRKSPIVIIENHDDDHNQHHHHHHKHKNNAQAAVHGFATSCTTNLLGYAITKDAIKSSLLAGSSDLALGLLHKKYYKNSAYWVGAGIGWVTSMALIGYLTSK
ncbi:MAG: hypothetical protein ACOYT8_05525 [Candidatus Dependentiae bacterium]